MTKTRDDQNKKSIHEIMAEGGKAGRFHGALEMVHASYAANSREQAAQDILTNELSAIGLQVEKLEGGGNNKNFLVTNPLYPDEKVVIQICRKSAEAETGFNKVTSGGTSEWQPITFDSVTGHATDGSNNADFIHVTAMEYCPGSLKKAIENADDAQRIKVAIDVGSQLSEVLTYFAKKGVIWTDMKPGNLLMRAIIQIVIADTKGIMDPAGLYVRKNGTIQMGDLTKEYLSEDFQLKWQMNTKPETVLNVWNKEYSYQLAVVLHYMATGTERHAYISPWQEEQQKQLMNSNEPVFNFNYPIFQTEQGKRLQTVIENLGAKDSTQRFRHADGVECLKVLDNPVEFAKNIDTAKKYAPKGAALVESMSTEKAMKYMKAMKDIEQAQAKFTAAKAEERVDKKEQGVRGKLKTAIETIREKAESVKKAIKPDEKHKENIANENQNNTTRPKMR